MAKRMFFEGTAHTYVKVYDKCKYETGAKVIAEVDYEKVVEYGVFNSSVLKLARLMGSTLTRMTNI